MVPDKLFVGNSLTVFGRTYKITEYGDTSTKQNFVARKEKTLILIKPDAVMHCGKILTEV